VQLEPFVIQKTPEYVYQVKFALTQQCLRILAILYCMLYHSEYIFLPFYTGRFKKCLILLFYFNNYLDQKICVIHHSFSCSLFYN